MIAGEYVPVGLLLEMRADVRAIGHKRVARAAALAGIGSPEWFVRNFGAAMPRRPARPLVIVLRCDAAATGAQLRRARRAAEAVEAGLRG